MAKLTTNDLASLANQASAISTINANNALIETALENTLSRDGTSPNTMSSDIDINNNRLYNLPLNPSTNSDAATKYYVDTLAGILDGSLIALPSSVFYASGAVINWNAGDVLLTHSVNQLSFTGATNGYRFDNPIVPTTNDGTSVGTTALSWSDLFLANGGVINWANGGTLLTNSGAGTLTLTGSSAASIQLRGTGSSNIEIGRVDGALSTPFIDFHSGAVATDYDSRLIASGGTGVAGNGALAVDAIGGFNPASNDRGPLGTSTLSWSDLFLASGGVINFNNGNYTLTHSTGQLTASGGFKSSSPSAGIGYTTGAGNTVTQITSKTTGVTINNICGRITMNNAALASNTTIGFVVTNSAAVLGDVVIVNIVSGAVDSGTYLTWSDNLTSGSFVLRLRNISGGSLGEAVVLQYTIIKGVTS